MAADGLVSRLSEVVVDAGRLAVSGLAISSDVGNDVRDAVASESTESMETEAAECGVDDKALAGENEVIKGEGVVGEEEEGVEVELVVAEEPFPFTRYFDGSGMPKADATGTRIAVMIRGVR
ncbi:Ff.00g111830.m01.CDS01 [Fusarium sp. VM40]|nr:Ff.00g111830.m01.CDS01 [Fusarium sp. VM40]